MDDLHPMTPRTLGLGLLTPLRIPVRRLCSGSLSPFTLADRSDSSRLDGIFFFISASCYTNSKFGRAIFQQMQSDLPQMQNHLPQMQSDLPHVQRDVPQLQSDVPQMQSCLPQLQSEVPQMQSDIPQVRSDLPHVQSDLPHLQNDLPHV